MSERPKFPAAEARAVANEVLDRLTPLCERVIIAGSLRRHRSHVSDIEILFIPRLIARQATLFDAPEMSDLVDPALSQWVSEGYLKKRPNVDGSPCWGPMNKLAIHSASNIPVDFFAVLPVRCPLCNVVGNDYTVTPKPETVQSNVRCLPQALPGEKSEGLQQVVQCPAPVERREGSQERAPLPHDDLCGLQTPIPEQKLLEGSEMLRQEVRGNFPRESVPEKSEVEGAKEGLYKQSGLRSGVHPISQDFGTKERLCASASASDGTSSKEKTTADRDRPPSERSEERQPNRESGDSLSTDSSRASGLSPLSAGLPDSLAPCKICGGKGWHAPNWWNSLVMRTGGKKSNLALTMAANKLGYRFEAYGSGFQKIGKAERHESTSEADIFRFARLRYFEPQFRS